MTSPNRISHRKPRAGRPSPPAFVRRNRRWNGAVSRFPWCGVRVWVSAISAILVSAISAILVSAISAIPLHAARPYHPQQPDPILESWRWRTFPELKGLGLRCLAEAIDGAMWFGVDDGARRYDGVHWTAYTEQDGLPDPPVNTLLGARDGRVYAGTRAGIFSFQDGTWSRVFPLTGDLPCPVYDLMEASDGSVWAATEWGAIRLTGKEPVLYTTAEIGASLKDFWPDVTFSPVPEAAVPVRDSIGVAFTPTFGGHWGRNVPRTILWLSPDHPAWAAGFSFGDRILRWESTDTTLTLTLERASGQSTLTYDRRSVSGRFRDFRVHDIFEARDGTIWFGLMGGEIVHFTAHGGGPGGTPAWRLYTEKDGLDIGWSPRIAQTPDGTIWTTSGSAGAGVNRFDRGRGDDPVNLPEGGGRRPGESSSGGTWTSVSLRDMGVSNNNPSILVTQDGTLWVGKNVYRDGKWRIFGGSAEEEKSDFQRLNLLQPLPYHRLRLLEASDGAVWMAGLGQEAARLDYATSRWTTYDGLLFQCETPDGARWFISEDEGVVRQAGGVWTRYGIEDGLMDAPYRLISTREGALWAAGSHKGTAATALFENGGSGRSGESPGKGKWSLRVHPGLSWGIYPKTVFEARDGSLWFGGMVDWYLVEGRDFQGGVLRFDPSKGPVQDDKAWTHYVHGLPGRSAYDIAQTPDGVLWFGGVGGVTRFDGENWTRLTEPAELASSYVQALYIASDGDLWFGTRTYGVYRYSEGEKARPDRSADRPSGPDASPEGGVWTHYGVRDGLADDGIWAILQTGDGSVWVATARGTSRFDEGRGRSSREGGRSGESTVGGTSGEGGGRSSESSEWRGDDPVGRWVDPVNRRWGGRPEGRGTWTTQALPSGLSPGSGGLLQSRDGAIWINGRRGGNWLRRALPGTASPPASYGLQTIRYEPDTVPPETKITLSTDKVSQPGNTTLAWKGADPWRTTPENELQFSYRMDGGEWSPFSSETSKVFEQVPAGKHTFEVKARDRDFNEDPTPATVVFSVVPPVYREPWFIGLMAVLLGAIGLQARRIVSSNRKLMEANTAMSAANRELFRANLEVTQERALERARAEVASMKSSDDLKEVVEEMLKELSVAGVDFDLCVINIIDEDAGVRRQYGATREGWTGQTEMPLSQVSEAFIAVYRSGKPVVRHVDDALSARHFETRKLLGIATDVDRPTAIAEAPFAHGTLSLSTRKPEGFNEEDIALVEEFARVIALGYARFLDFQRVEAQNKALEAANAQIQQANRLKSQFLANMSHELRTPMNAIIGFTRLVLRRAGDLLPERQRENLEKVRASADHLLALINEILDLSKIESGRIEIQPSHFDLKTLVHTCCATVSPALGKPSVSLNADIPDGLGPVYTDEARVRQIVINLLSNALKFTDKGEVRVAARKDGDHLILTVTDTGIGIPPAEQEAIFEEFRQLDGSSTRRHQGTGLGLSITRKLIELLNGSIAVESSVDQGSTFTVRIPIHPGMPPDSARRASPAVQPAADNRTVVTIDDDPNIALLLREELAEEGYTIASATKADEGIDLVRRLNPEAVIVDIIMPGKDGWQTIATLKADPETRDTPIIVLSASDNRELGFRLGVLDYLVKPIRRDALLTALNRIDAGRDILIVDDEPVAVDMLRQMLETGGFAPRSAPNGREALEAIEQTRPDAILLDLMMPVMDGFAVIERLRADPEWKTIPIIIITAKDLTPEEEAYLHEHASRIVQKGHLDPDALGQDLRNILRQYREPSR